MHSYVVATIKSWHIEQYKKYSRTISGDWHLIQDRHDLTIERIKQINPRYIFFPHWSWIVPKEITDDYQCVCFHMTDLPYGRGGSPLQNLIVRGHKETKITAIRMTQELDAGDIYLKHSLDLSGSAQDIFFRASIVIEDMIKQIIANNPKTIAQTGASTFFYRRKPEQSKIPTNLTMTGIYDYIRMLDAETYPRAYIDYGDYRLLFRQAKLKGDKLFANVEIKINDAK